MCLAFMLDNPWGDIQRISVVCLIIMKDDCISCSLLVHIKCLVKNCIIGPTVERPQRDLNPRHNDLESSVLPLNYEG